MKRRIQRHWKMKMIRMVCLKAYGRIRGRRLGTREHLEVEAKGGLLQRDALVTEEVQKEGWGRGNLNFCPNCGKPLDLEKTSDTMSDSRSERSAQA